jgi:hypothetical protein
MKNKKTGGRLLGTPNRRTLEALEVFEIHSFCPLEKILTKLNNPEISNELYLNVCLKLMKFKFPERKAIEYENTPVDQMQLDELLKEAGDTFLNLIKGVNYERIKIKQTNETDRA